MSSRVIISIPKGLLQELDRITEEMETTRAETIRTAIRNLIKEKNVSKEN